MAEITRDLSKGQNQIGERQAIQTDNSGFFAGVRLAGDVLNKGAEVIAANSESAAAEHDKAILNQAADLYDNANTAMEQGASSSGTNTILASKIKRLKANNPHLITQLNGMATGSSSGGFIATTNTEKQQEALEMDAAMFKQQQVQDAQKAGYKDVDVYLANQRAMSDSARIISDNNAIASEGKMTSARLVSGMAADIDMLSNKYQVGIRSLISQKGGASPEDVQKALVQLGQDRIDLIGGYDRKAKGQQIPIPDRDAAKAHITTEIDAIEQNLKDGTLLKIFQENTQLIDAVITKYGTLNNMAIATANKIGGPEYTKWYLDTLSKPEIMPLGEKMTPGLRQLRESSTKTLKDAETMLQVIGGTMSMEDLSKADKAMVNKSAVAKLNDSSGLPKQMEDAASFLREQVEASGAPVLSSWDTNTTQVAVNSNPKLSKILDNTYDSVVIKASRDIQGASDVKLSGVSITVDPAPKSVGQFSSGRIPKRKLQFTTISPDTGQPIPAKGISDSTREALQLLIALPQRYPQLLKGKSLEEHLDGLVKLFKPEEEENLNKGTIDRSGNTLAPVGEEVKPVERMHFDFSK